MRIHKSDTVFECAIDNCNVVFRSLPAYRNYLRQRHFNISVGSFCEFRCSLNGCHNQEQSIKAIKKHANGHILAGQPVYCPLRCRTKKPFATCNSLRIHFMYMHRMVKPTIRSDAEFSGGGTINFPQTSPLCEEVIEGVTECTDTANKANCPSGIERSIEMTLGSLFLKLSSGDENILSYIMCGNDIFLSLFGTKGKFRASSTLV